MLFIIFTIYYQFLQESHLVSIVCALVGLFMIESLNDFVRSLVLALFDIDAGECFGEDTAVLCSLAVAVDLVIIYGRFVFQLSISCSIELRQLESSIVNEVVDKRQRA